MISPASTRIDLDRFLALKTAAERRLSAGPAAPVKAPAAPAKTLSVPAKTPSVRPAVPETGLLSAYGAIRPATENMESAPKRGLGIFFDAVA